MGSRAIRVTVRPLVAAEVWLTVAYGVPVAEVARQVDSAVRYGLERALGREVGPVAIHVQGVGGRPYASGTPATHAGLRRRIDRPPVREPMHDDMPLATDQNGSGRAPGTA
jgi:hypothetical protein